MLLINTHAHCCLEQVFITTCHLECKIASQGSELFAEWFGHLGETISGTFAYLVEPTNSWTLKYVAPSIDPSNTR